MQLDAVVEIKSSDILYLFGEPKLLIINPPCFQCLILSPISSKNTPMCRSGTSHPSVMVHVASTNHSILSDFFLNNSTTQMRPLPFTLTGRLSCWRVLGGRWLRWRCWCWTMSWGDFFWGSCWREGCRSSCTGVAAGSRQTGHSLPCCRPDIWSARPSGDLWGPGRRALPLYLKSRKKRRVTHQPFAAAEGWFSVSGEEEEHLAALTALQNCENVIISLQWNVITVLGNVSWRAAFLLLLAI